jgi:hypothetical protein
LLDSKEEWAYWLALNEVLIQSELKLDPAFVHCDFELALINAVTQQFPNAKIVGCLFHWKQALRRYLIRYALIIIIDFFFWLD